MHNAGKYAIYIATLYGRFNAVLPLESWLVKMNLDRIIAVRNNKTIYRDGSCSVKVFENGYSQPEIYREAYIQTLMHSIGLNVPKVQKVTEINGKTAIVFEYIRGRSLADMINSYPEKCEEFTVLIADLQYNISRKKASIRLLKEFISDSLQKSALSENEINELTDLLNELPQKNELLHGELIPQNIVLSRDGTPYIIDWEYASQGDVCYGHAATCISLLADRNNQAVRYYLDTVYDRYTIASEEIVRWLPLASVALSNGYFGNKRQFLLDHVHCLVGRNGGNI